MVDRFTGPLSYAVLTGTGQTWKRQVDQVRRRHTLTAPKPPSIQDTRGIAEGSRQSVPVEPGEQKELLSVHEQSLRLIQNNFKRCGGRTLFHQRR